MKKKRLRLELSNEQQLVLGLLLVVLLAVSLLYCLGFASLALRQAWEDTDLPWTTPETGEEILDITPNIIPPVTPSSSPTPSGLLNGAPDHWQAGSHACTVGPGQPSKRPVPHPSCFDRTMLHSYNLHAAAAL